MEGQSSTKGDSMPPTKEPTLPLKDDELDPRLWGNLQNYIPLTRIHEKMSQPDLLRLRLVCKAWNEAAMRRLLPNPYFMTIAPGYDTTSHTPAQTFLNGVVTYDEASGSCSFMHQRSRLPDVPNHVPPFAVKGLILCHTQGGGRERGVFNVHNRTWHAIPPPPGSHENRAVCGLMVDTSVRPYTFKLVEGRTNFNTQVYDSEIGVWSSRTSRQLPVLVMDLDSYNCTCTTADIFISTGMNMVLRYSMELDAWTKVDLLAASTPLSRRAWFPNDFGWFYKGVQHALGVWGGRIFITSETSDPDPCLVVWELMDPEKPEWREHARMSTDMYMWLFAHNSWSGGQELRSHQCFLSVFCEGYLLVCCWQWAFSRADAVVLFNMATGDWKQADLPSGTVRTSWSPEGEGPHNSGYTDSTFDHEDEDEDTIEDGGQDMVEESDEHTVEGASHSDKT